jgi:hypothetical protein
MCRAVSRQAAHQRGSPRTRTSRSAHDSRGSRQSHCVTGVENASLPSHPVNIPFAVSPVSHASHPTINWISIQSASNLIVRAPCGPGGGRRGSTTGRRPTRSRLDAGPQDIKTKIRVSNVTCVECAPPRGVELTVYKLAVLRENLILSGGSRSRADRATSDAITRICRLPSPISARFRAVRVAGVARVCGVCGSRAVSDLPTRNGRTDVSGDRQTSRMYIRIYRLRSGPLRPLRVRVPCPGDRDAVTSI